MTNNLGILGFFVYCLFGLYLVNFAFDIIPLPVFIGFMDKWVIFISGILIIIGGINYLRVRNKPI